VRFVETAQDQREGVIGPLDVQVPQQVPDVVEIVKLGAESEGGTPRR
jgi:hypothetical protein